MASVGHTLPKVLKVHKDVMITKFTGMHCTAASNSPTEYYLTQGGATVHTDDMLPGRKWAESRILLSSTIFGRTKQYLSRVAARVETDAEKWNLGQMCHALVCRRTEPAERTISISIRPTGNIYLTVISSFPYCTEVEYTIFAIAAMFV